MDYYENWFSEELVALRSEHYDEKPIINDEICFNYYDDIGGAGGGEWLQSGDCFGEIAIPPPPATVSACFDDECLAFAQQSQDGYCSPFPDFYCGGYGPQLLGDEESFLSNSLLFPSFPEIGNDFSCCRGGGPVSSSVALEPFPAVDVEAPAGCIGDDIRRCSDENESEDKNKKAVKSKMNKVHGKPSKNLMAERRRRKRLNDRLSMLRSVVPKISKMDRTSILGDTIEYMKELLGKINTLQVEMEMDTKDLTIFNNVKPNETELKNSPKFEVERRGEKEAKIEICCGGRAGLLLSTVATLETLGLEIQHCVISCFNDFALQASCTTEKEQKKCLSSEEIKQTLFRNAGYGGKGF
ncbi:unnamed protein product [Cuscuta campestris]|uniref:BHLH domain-containing protein n=1 Tax=Cuscuta campestris TaxID=132261 RepID=A0A484MDK9_9ASTE|nr:unnamed protein product [Cuscuta campestris]